MTNKYQRPARCRVDDIVDTYLTTRFCVGLEQALLDATGRRLTPCLAQKSLYSPRYIPKIDGTRRTEGLTD